jgi:hypothetical protein
MSSEGSIFCVALFLYGSSQTANNHRTKDIFTTKSTEDTEKGGFGHGFTQIHTD